MSNTPHTLGEEFPGQLEQIHALKASDARFAKLLLDYDEVNDEVHSAETEVIPVSQNHETESRKRRLSLMDEIAKALAQNA
jgi:uncharacterized protein YdcH (DUF465 family)